MSNIYHLSELPTIGIEEEHFVVSAQTGDLFPLTEKVQRKLSSGVGEQLTFEYKACQLELRTSPATSGDKLNEEISELRAAANMVLSSENLKLLTKSTHPTGKWADQPSRNDKRYRKIEMHHGQVVKRLLVSGLHIHVGTILDRNVIVRRLAQLWPITPVLIAANASSELWEGRDTGHVSYRRNILIGLGAQCPPPAKTQSAYESHLGHVIEMNSVKSESDLWFDIRPGRKGLNTVELRSADISGSGIQPAP